MLWPLVSFGGLLWRSVLFSSATATDALQPGRGPGVLRQKRVLVFGSRGVFLDRFGFFDFWRRRRVVAGEPCAGAFERAAVRAGGTRAWREGAQRQHGDKYFHPFSFAGVIAQESI